MMKILFCTCLLFVLSQCERKSYHGEKVYRLFPSNEQQYRQFNSLVEAFELDIWKKARFIGDSVDVRVSLFHQSQFNVFLDTTGIKSRVFINDLLKLIDEQTKPHPVAKNLQSFNYEVYHSLDEIEQWIDDMALENSDLVTKYEVGKSYEQRNILALKVGVGSDNKPKFFMSCGVHAREWITPATCLFTIFSLVDGYKNNDPFITNVLESIDFIFVPIVNVDGYSYSWTDNRMWRKTRTQNSANGCIGVDANRNYDINFGGVGSSRNPCSETFNGKYPFSENCTAAHRQFVEDLNNVQAYIDIHSYGQLWMHPYGFKEDSSLSDDILFEIGQNAVAAVYSKHGKNYTPGKIYNVLYPASGMVTDYFYEVTRIPCSYLVELRDEGEYGFLLPETQIKETTEEAFAGFMVIAQAILDGKCTSIE